MAMYTVSDKKIEPEKKRLRHRWTLIFIVTFILMQILPVFIILKEINNYSDRSFFGGFMETYIIIQLCVLIPVLIALFFITKSWLKSKEEEMKSTQYILENERLVIKKNGREYYSISWNEIDHINKYRDNTVIIFLKENKKITIDKFLDNYNQLVADLDAICRINELDKNPGKVLRAGKISLQVIVFAILFWSSNALLVLPAGLIMIIYGLKSAHNEPEGSNERKTSLALAAFAAIILIVKFVF